MDKLKNAKRVLIDLQNLFIAKDKNHLILMNYFGSQIEIIGRIISAFAGHQYKGPLLGVEGHKKLTMWFTSVHSVNIWCQKEILSLGIYYMYLPLLPISGFVLNLKCSIHRHYGKNKVA